MILEVTRKHQCEKDEIQRTFVSTVTCEFQLFLSITQVYIASVQILLHK